MLDSSRLRIEGELGDDAVVLDVGGWAKPFPRANWVLDLMPYETRGLYGVDGSGQERFSAETWVERDICAREPWPFEDDQFDFAICSHTLEDVRDPIWVAAELSRVARAGYVEVPSRLEEQTRGIAGPFVGWSHHHWLIDRLPDCLQFVAKAGVVHGPAEFSLPRGFAERLGPEDRVETLFWNGSLECRERVFYERDDFHAYLAEAVARGIEAFGVPPQPGGVRKAVTRIRQAFR